MREPIKPTVQNPRPRPSLGPVPWWEDLPDHARRDLSLAGFHQSWFNGQSNAEIRLTVLVLYVKLSGLHLWPYVQRHPDKPTERGKLHGDPRRAMGLRPLLLARSDFTDPEASEVEWSSREKRQAGSLHLKQWRGYSNGFQTVFIEAHIDYHGLIMGNAAWCFPPLQLGQVIAHGLSRNSYTDIHRLRALLLAQGWDPATLLGRRAAPRRLG